MLRQSIEIIDLVSLGQIDAVKELLERKDIDVNQQDENGNSAVLIAVTRNDLPMLQLLVKIGAANLDTQDAFGYSPLEGAEKHNNIEMINFIKNELKRNIKANITTRLYPS